LGIAAIRSISSAGRFGFGNATTHPAAGPDTRHYILITWLCKHGAQFADPQMTRRDRAATRVARFAAPGGPATRAGLSRPRIAMRDALKDQ
jgi:hypothetical protein